MRQQFQETLEELEKTYEARLQQLREDLELQRRVEIHEIEEVFALFLKTLLYEELFPIMIYSLFF